ncbi:PucR family transcriptional regulator [Oceanobacillus piezotolerans]|uniref:PucR family transcriptional regulator n=1 Tax=Oceanobacillus piezotolerans TaxID=2448030 RepID=A0A498DL95_9BACI|nr:XylR N-terminal domain-containing protein [Oceanobacillus piezotolerans]RLL43749.1 PucR family transcriptional regulator [Oceanobacillus piezotolerans]
MEKYLQLERDIRFSDDGLIYSEDHRAIMVPTSSFGILRKDLYSNIGKERVKGFLLRYGFDLGQKDAKIILKKFKGDTIESIIKKGPVYHQLYGHVIPTVNDIKIEKHGNKVSTYLEGTWENSYEAMEHIEQFGISDEPVCDTLVGYANGFLTKVCNQTVLFKEVCCVGKGDKICKWVGRTVDYWTNDMNDELKYYKEEPIVKELELTYEKLLEERNHLKNVSIIHNKLTEEILKGKNLNSIMGFVYNLTNTAILIESSELQPIASGGLPSGILEDINLSFLQYVQCKESMKKTFHRTKIIKLEDHTRITTPVFLQGKTIGYCSFVYKEELAEDKIRFLQMIIERISSICALYILNKKTETEAEDRMKGRFLERILNGEYTKEEILRQSSFIGLDLFQPYYIVVIQAQMPNQNYKEEFTLLKEVMNRTSTYFQKRRINVLLGQLADDFVLLFLKSEIAEIGIRATCSQYLNDLTKIYPSVSFRAGISMQSDEIEKAADSYHEALTSKRMSTISNNVIEFQTLGILGPLINSNNQKEVERIAIYTIKPLGDDLDDPKNLEIIKTLYVYLLHGGNLEQTASDLALSLSGLRYRIGKIEKIMEQDLRNPEVSYKLLLSIQALISTGKIDLIEY